MDRPLINYHAHTWRCQHATGTEEDYIRQAIASGFEVCGFSDHTPWPYKSSFVSGMRMRIDQLEGYIATVRRLSEEYADRIRIPLGLECEAFPEYYGWLRDLKAARLDFVIMGNHYDYNDETGGFYFGDCCRPKEARRYVERTVDGMRTGLYDYVAHPDLFLRLFHRFNADCAAISRDLCQAAAELNLPLEYNLLGVQRLDESHRFGGLGYPCQQFWEVAAQYPVRAIVGLDAHRTDHFTRIDLFEQAWRTLDALGIEVVTQIGE